ncbi:hypothetical protein D0863_00211 [Hortaea werneckii]|uniref:Hypervirulence associated protein TUDOR domain-containing protein n=1 Tax=Hortaea werneckii TaxID=91943 RepID=A0A3M7ERB9_HORWE|nr:hypothetical protein D0863_00211 [Hortaea werneckii]
MPPKEKYTNPELRDQVKEEIQESDKGGQPGQWSARKAQMMAQEYKKRGGDYNTDKSQQDDSQKNLSKWSEEEWQTKEGSGHAKQEDGTEKRYLPKKAWEQMDDQEKEETDEKKQEESKEGKQFVGNTGKAKEARQEANEEESEQYEKKKSREQRQKASEGQNGKHENEENDDAELEDDDDDVPDAAEEDKADGEAAAEDDGEEAKTGEKRKSGGRQQQNGSAKKQKSTGQGNAPPGKVGSKHMDDNEPAPRGSADRLPKKGQKITWKAMPGFVNGTVTDILTSGKKVDGKDVKASKSDPRLVMKSDSSGKVCVHKPDACFYEDE